VACRLIASVLDSGGWATVKAAVNRHRRAARPPTGCAWRLLSLVAVVAGARFELWKRLTKFEFLLAYW